MITFLDFLLQRSRCAAWEGERCPETKNLMEVCIPVHRGQFEIVKLPSAVMVKLCMRHRAPIDGTSEQFLERWRKFHG